jgi:small-conductance mechanosensitive channel
LKRPLLVCLFFGAGLMTVQAQQKKTDPCAEIKELYDIVLYHLDSTIGVNNKLQKQLDNLQHTNAKSKTDSKAPAKTNSETKSELESAKKLIMQQSEEIRRLQSEVKRLSNKTSG